MLDGCNEISQELKETIAKSAATAARLGATRIGTDHLLFSLAEQSTSIAATALASMKIDALLLQKEIEKLSSQKDFLNCESSRNELPGNSFLSHICFKSKASKSIPFSDAVIKALAKADDLSHYLGQEEIAGAHLLLALIGNNESCASLIFEELSINTTFLKAQILRLMAAYCFKAGEARSLRSVLSSGLKQLVEKYTSALYMVRELVQKSKITIIDSPKREAILCSVCVAYLAECLYNQVAFQRYLLEEALSALSSTVGSLNQEIASQIISMTAQHLRKQARQGIEYVWTDEYRSIQHMLSDAEYDLIGSVIEDLWWSYSEDIALDKSFTSALADHRKSHLLELQERRVELSQRLHKVKNRLEDTIRQCFKNRNSV